MKSIEELRKVLKSCTNEAGIEPNKFDTYWITAKACDMLIDEIEAEIADNYMRLPVDANNEPIHVGDNLHSDETGRNFPCRGYNLTLQGSKKWWTVECCYDSYSGTSEYVSAKSCRHVKPRTLEDVLVDMLEAAVGYSDAHTDVSLVAVEKYADEIRELLGGDAE